MSTSSKIPLAIDVIYCDCFTFGVTRVSTGGRALGSA